MTDAYQTYPIPFEKEDEELGNLVLWYAEKLPLQKLFSAPSRLHRNGKFVVPSSYRYLHATLGIFLMGRVMPMPGPGGRMAELETGRNDPCPCGSGKKYKKCCAG